MIVSLLKLNLEEDCGSFPMFQITVSEDLMYQYWEYDDFFTQRDQIV